MVLDSSPETQPPVENLLRERKEMLDVLSKFARNLNGNICVDIPGEPIQIMIDFGSADFGPADRKNPNIDLELDCNIEISVIFAEDKNVDSGGEFMGNYFCNRSMHRSHKR